MEAHALAVACTVILVRERQSLKVPSLRLAILKKISEEAVWDPKISKPGPPTQSDQECTNAASINERPGTVCACGFQVKRRRNKEGVVPVSSQASPNWLSLGSLAQLGCCKLACPCQH